jgi:hypothetical protein
MPGRSDKTGFTSDAPEERRASGVSLAAARSILERHAGRRGTEHWSAGESDREKDREIELLRQWADEVRAWLPHEQVRYWGHSAGAQEHDFKVVEDRFWKATKGGRFGFYPQWTGRAGGRLEGRCDATPYQYLTRLHTLNDWTRSLPGLGQVEALTRLEGLAVLDGALSLITSQPAFAHDPVQPEKEEIAAWLRVLSFQKIDAATWYSPGENLALFDVAPRNVIRSSGVFVPVDVIPVKPWGVLESILRDATRMS